MNDPRLEFIFPDSVSRAFILEKGVEKSMALSPQISFYLSHFLTLRAFLLSYSIVEAYVLSL